MYPFGIKEYFEEKSQEFYLFIVPYHAANFEKNPLIYKHSWFWATVKPKSPIKPKRWIFGNSSKLFLSSYCTLSCYKVWEKILEGILMHKLAKYWAKIALLTQKRILVEDTEKFYKEGKFTDPQTERERESDKRTTISISTYKKSKWNLMHLKKTFR